MSKIAAPLSDSAIKKLTLGKKKTDGQCKGLMVERVKDGRTFWRIKFKTVNKDGIEAWTMRSLGEYPSTTLEAARKAHKRLHWALEHGLDVEEAILGIGSFGPTESLDGTKPGDSFGKVFELWAENRKDSVKEITHYNNKQKIENYVMPYWRKKDIRTITAEDAILVMKKAYKKTPGGSHRILGILRDVWNYAKVIKKVDENIFNGLSKSRDIGKVEKGNHAAIIEEEELALFLKTVEDYKGEVVKIALKLSAHCFLRSSELRCGTWDEVDFKKKIWTIPAGRMKMKESHIVPLSDTVVELLRELENYKNGDANLMFPSPASSSRPISNMILGQAIKRMGFEATQHGFRATFRTLGSEVLEFPNHLQEHQLAHVVKDVNGTAYNRTKHLAQRHKMMNRWSEYLESLTAEEE